MKKIRNNFDDIALRKKFDINVVENMIHFDFKQIEYENRQLGYENNLKFETFYDYIKLLNYLHHRNNTTFKSCQDLFSIVRKWNNSEFQYYTDLLSNIPETNDSQLQEFINSKINNNISLINKDYITIVSNIIIYLHELQKWEFNLFIEFINFLRKCNNSIFEYYIMFGERLLGLKK
jgi:hypothetical protein